MKYTGQAYFTGGLFPEAPGNEISAFTSDRGELVKLRATPQKIASLRIVDIHYSEINRINLILSCDSITINGTTYQNEEGIEIEEIPDSDLVNITAKIIQTNYNYYVS